MPDPIDPQKNHQGEAATDVIQMTPFEHFIFPATARSELWRSVSGIIIVYFVWRLCLEFFNITEPFLWIALTDNEATKNFYPIKVLDSGPILEVSSGISFLGIWIGVWLVSRYLHAQRFETFFSPQGMERIWSFLKGTLFGLSFAILWLILILSVDREIRPGLAPLDLVAILVPIVLSVFIQAGGEELVFRGYLLRQCAALSKHWIVWAGVPSLLFGILHYSTQFAESYAYYRVAYTFLIGLIASALVWRGGTLWAAIGFHVAINVSSQTLLGSDWFTSTTHLWIYTGTKSVRFMEFGVVLNIILLIAVLSPLGRVFETHSNKIRSKAVP